MGREVNYQIKKHAQGFLGSPSFKYTVHVNGGTESFASTYWGARFIIWRDKRSRRRNLIEQKIVHEETWCP